ncbi:hypothetical protein ACIKT0_01625 [Hansschlegelia beijingensis]|uniref:hypothetical protein n=1 Tax=Hansschlegelia beijingensis TaxID=1133344 RepID=UPI00387F262F
MNLLSRAAACGLLALSLAACSAAQQAAFDAVTARGVDIACANLPRAELLYAAALVSGQARPSKRISGAFATVKSGCAARAAGADVTGVAASMLLAYVAIKTEVPQVEPLPAGLERSIVLKRGA